MKYQIKFLVVYFAVLPGSALVRALGLGISDVGYYDSFMLVGFTDHELSPEEINLMSERTKSGMVSLGHKNITVVFHSQEPVKEVA